MNNFNILGESSFENPYPSVIVAPDFATNIYPSINTAIANSSGIPQPFPGTFIATDFESQTQNSINDTLQKIDNFQPSTLNQTNINGKLTTTDDITSTKFIVQGGTNIQYLLADGSTLTQSANSGNSNFYLYTSINTSFAPPITAGNVEYNNANQSLATIVYISHLTRDNIDIEIFFQNISTLNILYLQDQNDSTNYIRYDITGNATIVANSYISVPVAVIDSAGTGTTSFGTSHNILLSVFTNTQETNTRLSAVETKTQNQTAVSNTTTFAGRINIDSAMEIWRESNTLKISNILASNDSADNVLCYGVSSITSDNTIKPKIQYLSAVSPNETRIGSNFIPLTNNTYDLGSTSKRFNNAYVNAFTSTSISSSGLDMNTNKITNLATPTLTTDATNKLYVDSYIPPFKGYPFNTIQNATGTTAASNKSFFYTIPINRPTIISGFRVYVSTGSDNLRIGIYRGFIKATPLSTATLVGQSAITPGVTSLPFTNGAIIPVIGQNLSFTTGEYMLIGFGSSGTTNIYLTSPLQTALGNDIAFIASANYVTSGFLATMTTVQQASTLAIKICFELF